MTRLSAAISRARAAVAGSLQAFVDWQAEIPAEGRVVLVGLLALSGGIAFAQPALIAPGLLLVSVGVGVNYRHPLAGVVLIVCVTLVVVAGIAWGAI